VRALPGNEEMTFSIPSAPILIPEGPWKEVEGCINAPKGFKSQGMLKIAMIVVIPMEHLYLKMIVYAKKPFSICSRNQRLTASHHRLI
jgi:hypothetical protein